MTDLGTRTERRGRLRRTAGIAALVAAVAVVPQLGGGPSGPASAGPGACPAPPTPLDRSLTHPTGQAIVEWVVDRYGDVAAMTAGSDLVVRACVKDISRGPYEYDPPDPEPVLQGRVITLAVQELLAGEAPKTVKAFDGWWSRGVGVANREVPWSQIGDSGFFFLSRTPMGIYTIINKGRVLIKDGKLVPTTGAPIRTTLPAELAEQIRTAAD